MRETLPPPTVSCVPSTPPLLMPVTVLNSAYATQDIRVSLDIVLRALLARTRQPLALPHVSPVLQASTPQA